MSFPKADRPLKEEEKNEWMNTPYSFSLFFDSMWQRIGGSIYQGNSNSIMQLNLLLTYTYTRITHHWSLSLTLRHPLSKEYLMGVFQPTQNWLRGKRRKGRTTETRSSFSPRAVSSYCTVCCSFVFFFLLFGKTPRKEEDVTEFCFLFSRASTLWEEAKAKKKIQESW